MGVGTSDVGGLIDRMRVGVGGGVGVSVVVAAPPPVIAETVTVVGDVTSGSSANSRAISVCQVSGSQRRSQARKISGEPAMIGSGGVVGRGQGARGVPVNSNTGMSVAQYMDARARPVDRQLP